MDRVAVFFLGILMNKAMTAWSCTDLEDPAHGRVIIAREQAIFVCDQGYKLNFYVQLRCVNNDWIGPRPECLPIDCGYVSGVPFGRVTYTPATGNALSSTTVGSVATYTCNSGFSLGSGTQRRACLNSGRWSGIQPTCHNINDCTPNSCGLNTVCVDQVGSTLCSCMPGWMKGSGSSRDCNTRAASCSDSPCRLGGSCELTTPSASNNYTGYSCQCLPMATGYNCDIAKGCEEFPQQLNGEVKYSPESSTRVFSVATFTCNPGYTLSDPSRHQMQCVLRAGNYHWEHNAPQCLPINCGEVEAIANGYINYPDENQTTLHSQVVYTCSSGTNMVYRMWGNIRTCRHNGWDGVAPICSTYDTTELSVASDVCASLQCNHGVCLEGRCHCHSNWHGPSCSILDVCGDHVCLQGTCVESSRCVCDPGYTGARCDLLDGQTCADVACVHGTCDEELLVCQCERDYGGIACEQPLSHHCHQSNLHCQNGTCDIGNQSCRCYPGFVGQLCEDIDPKYCYSKDLWCVNGVCDRDTETCQCNQGYEGSTCEAERSRYCETSRLQCVHGFCDVITQTCHCLQGYVGRACDAVIDSCTYVNCAQGVCTDGACVCHAGYTGVLCDSEVDPCSGVNCVHGTCDSGQCSCQHGYTGTLCDATIDRCIGVRCAHGTCINGLCICQQGYSGRLCDVISDPCIAVTCAHGTCTNGLCLCDQGYSGTLCDIDLCASVNCVYGACTLGRCVCETGYTGRLCDTTVVVPTIPPPKGFCAGTICLNGKCVAGRCTCLLGYSGSTCTTRVGVLCGADMCVYGRCESGTECRCEEGYKGERCDVSVVCGERECWRGECVYGTCVCHQGYTGDTCQQQVEVEQNLCGDSECINGTCVSARCVCDSGYSGKYCNASIPTVTTVPPLQETKSECSAPLSIPNGVVTRTPEGGLAFGTVAEYQCEEGFILAGPDRRVCLDTGSWSGPQPQCTVLKAAALSSGVASEAAEEEGAYSFLSGWKLISIIVGAAMSVLLTVLAMYSLIKAIRRKDSVSEMEDYGSSSYGSSYIKPVGKGNRENSAYTEKWLRGAKQAGSFTIESPLTASEQTTVNPSTTESSPQSTRASSKAETTTTGSTASDSESTAASESESTASGTTAATSKSSSSAATSSAASSTVPDSTTS